MGGRRKGSGWRTSRVRPLGVPLERRESARDASASPRRAGRGERPFPAQLKLILTEDERRDGLLLLIRNVGGGPASGSRG